MPDNNFQLSTKELFVKPVVGLHGFSQRPVRSIMSSTKVINRQSMLFLAGGTPLLREGVSDFTLPHLLIGISKGVTDE